MKPPSSWSVAFHCGLVVGALLFLSAVFVSPGLALDVVRSENWDGDWAADWSIEGDVWEVGRPLNTGIGEPSAPSGQNCAATSLNAKYPSRASTRLIWSEMEIPGDRPRLRFLHWMRMSRGDIGYVAVRLEGSSVWTVMSDFCADVNEGDQSDCGNSFDTQGLWTPVSVDLSLFAGERAEIGFVFVSNGVSQNVGWYVDDVRMESGGHDFDSSEDWESGYRGWHAAMGLWEIGEPSPLGGPSGARSGASCIGTLLTSDFPNNHSSRLVSPVFTVPSDRPRLRFWQWKRSPGNDDGTVWIRPRGTETWTQIGPVTPATTHEVWAPVSLDLGAFAGEEVELSFLFDSNGVNTEAGWFLDDVTIETGPYEFADLLQNWEGDWKGWHAQGGLWEQGSPVEGPGRPGAGAGCIGTRLDSDYANGATSRLVSPRFRVPTDRPRLRFLHWAMFGPGGSDNGDHGSVWVRPVGSDTWDQVGLDSYGPSTGGLWVPESISLDSLAGQEVEISFLFSASGVNPGAGWFLDEIEVDSGDYEAIAVQGWESGYGDWAAPQGLWEIGDPVGGPGGPANGSACIGTLLNGNYPNGAYAELTSPPMEIPVDSAVSLRFDHWLEVASGDGGNLYYQLPGDNWRSLSSFGASTADWSPVSALLPPELHGKPVRFRFLFVSNGVNNRAGWFLDDIGIVSSAPPVVASVQPADGSMVGEARPVITVEFDQPVVGALSPAAWTVSGTVSGEHTGQIATVDDTIFAYTFLRDLADGETVTVNLESTIQSIDGDPLAPYSWSFDVGYDGTCPQVASVQPGDGQTAVDPLSAIVIEFDEEVRGADDTAAWTVEASGSGALAGQVSVSGCCTFEWRPTAGRLPEGETVTVRLDASRIQDLAGNPLCAPFLSSFAVREIVSTPVEHVYNPGIPGGRYLLVTVPLDVGDGTTLSEAFAALGDMGKTNWLGYGFEDGQLVEDPVVEPGHGYWVALASEDGRAFRVSGFEHTNPVRVELEPGWNLVGVPWISDQIRWRDLSIEAGSEVFALGSTEARAWVDDSVLWYVDDSGDLENNGTYVDASLTGNTTLSANAWGGYFLYASQECTLVFSRPGGRASNPSAALPESEDPASAPRWSVTFRANSPSGSDGNIRIGALGGDRSRSVRKPPLPGGSISLAIDDAGQPLLLSYRKGGDGDRWLLRLSGSAESVTMSWNGVHSLPAGRYLYLRTESGRVVDMAESGEVTFWNDGNAEIEVYLSGDPIPQMDPAELRLQAGPNPVRRHANVTLSLPRSGRVEVDVVNVTGRSVAALVSGWLEAGTHAVDWAPEADRTPSGTYFVRLRSGGREVHQKMIVVR